jgi:cellulase/cellobiase CelA1
VRYAVTNQWQGGFQADVTITNTATTGIDGWSLTWTFAGGQQLSQAWNATYSAVGATVTAGNVAWNATIPAGGTAGFGFIASGTGSNAVPAGFRLGGVACTSV